MKDTDTKRPVDVGSVGEANGSRAFMPKNFGEVVNGIIKLGVSSALALGLVWWMTQVVSAKLDEHMKTTAELVEHMKQDSEQQWQLVSVAQRICLNTAKNDADRLGCVVTAKRQQ
jgi:hypothetical protein